MSPLKQVPRPTYTPGQVLVPWVSPTLIARPSPVQGVGLFAQTDIPAGVVLIVWGGTIYTGADLLAGKANPDSVAVLDENLYLADPADAAPQPDYPLNHACDPNLWLQDAVTLVTRRAVAADEELTADYALWLDDPAWVLQPCRCGSALCRRRITGRDWQIPALQQRYRGHFTPFLNLKISRLQR